MTDISIFPLLLRTTAALTFTVGLIVIVAWALRRYNGLTVASTKAPPRLKILEKRTLNTTTTLYLIQHGEHEHLVASTNAQTTLLHTQPKHAKKPQPNKKK